jgi:hypothetical protein
VWLSILLSGSLSSLYMDGYLPKLACFQCDWRWSYLAEISDRSAFSVSLCKHLCTNPCFIWLTIFCCNLCFFC